jgi:hypothetical protein
MILASLQNALFDSQLSAHVAELMLRLEELGLVERVVD